MEVFSTCVRITVLTVSYLIPSVFFMNNMLVRRRSQTLRVAVISVGLLIKNVVIAYLLPNSSLDELTVMGIQFLYAVLFAFAAYFLLCYAYYGSILKLGIIHILTETNYLVFLSTLLSCINRIEGRSDPGGYGIIFLFPDLLMIPTVYGLFRLEIFLLKPWLPKIRTFEPKHRKILWGGVTAYFLAGISSIFWNFVELGFFNTLALLPVIILSVPGCAGGICLYAGYRRRTKHVNAFAHSQKELMLLHMEAVREQILRMESEQKMIDAQMDEIQKLEQSKDGSDRIKKYLGTLKESYRMIQAGAYSDDLLVDAVLYHYGQILAEKGIQPEFSFGGYRKRSLPEENTAEILMNLLGIGMAENISWSGERKTRFLRLQGGTVKNQVVFRMECGRRNGKWREKYGISYGALKRCVRRLGGQIDIIKRLERVQIQVVLERK